MSEASETSDGHQASTIDHPGMLEDSAVDPLTRIRGAYTLASPQEPNANEVDGMIVRHFLNTLADVAMDIAARRTSG